MKKFLNTAAGSWLKAFVVAMLTLVIANNGLKEFDWMNAIQAAALSVLPSIVNWFNSEDKRYGNNKQRGH